MIQIENAIDAMDGSKCILTKVNLLTNYAQYFNEYGNILLVFVHKNMHDDNWVGKKCYDFRMKKCPMKFHGLFSRFSQRRWESWKIQNLILFDYSVKWFRGIYCPLFQIVIVVVVRNCRYYEIKWIAIHSHTKKLQKLEKKFFFRQKIVRHWNFNWFSIPVWCFQWFQNHC